jgi:orotate phosphoribosyltransferase-like protein
MMSRIDDLLIDIEDLYYEGLSAEAIAKELGAPLELVQQAVVAIEKEAEDAYNDERDQFNSDLEADADALASAGWGVAEDYVDYVMDNDYMD